MKFKRVLVEYLKRMVAAAVVTKVVDLIMSKIGRSDEGLKSKNEKNG